MAIQVTRRELLAVAGLTAAAGCNRGGSKAALAPVVPAKSVPMVHSVSSIKLQPEDVEMAARGGTRYEALRKGYNLRISHHPIEIAVCKTSAGVAQAVKYAAARGWKVS